jgi:hypothetical protein
MLGCAIAGLFLAWLATGPVPAASAGIVNFDLASCAEAGLPAGCNNSDSGRSVLDFLSGGLDLNVSGFALGSPNNFDLKLGTANETGLGLFGATPANEVGPGDTEVFNFGKLAALGITSGTMTLTSLQEGEVGTVAFDATAVDVVQVGSTGISAPIPFTFSLADPLVVVSANSGDVLTAADVEITVPEPGSWLLVGTGLLGLAVWRLRKS